MWVCGWGWGGGCLQDYILVAMCDASPDLSVVRAGTQTEASEEAREMQEYLSQQLALHREGGQKAVALL